VIFRLPPGTPNREVGKFVKRFYGQETSSWKGRYSYRRQGLLDGIPHRKLLRGVILLRKSDLPPILTFLKAWRARVEVRRVWPTPKDLSLLEELTALQGAHR